MKVQAGEGQPSKVVMYTYNAEGQRTKKYIWKGPNLEETTIYLDGIFEKSTKFGGLSQTYTHMAVGDRKLFSYRTGDLMDDLPPADKWTMQDALGSVSCTTDGSGTVLSVECYYAFGETAFGSYTRKRYRYCGKERDGETGLYYYGARYYDAWTCRFVSVDPLADKYAYLSTYNYAGNNPISYTDIDGEQSEANQTSPSGGGGGVVGESMPEKDNGRVTGVKPPNVAASPDNTRVDGPKGVPGLDSNNTTNDGVAFSGRFPELELANPNANKATGGTSGLVKMKNLFGSDRLGPDWLSYVPIIGSARDAVRDFKQERYGWAVFNAVLAISDVFLIKSIGVGIAKGAFKMTGVHTWGATKHWLRKQGFSKPGDHLHHWAITQQTAKKYGIEAIANQPWNIVRFSSDMMHKRVGHGLHYGPLKPANLLHQYWGGRPGWYHAATISSGGRATEYPIR